MPRPSSAPIHRDRPCVRGKFIEVGGEKLLLRGVTYGPFREDAEGVPYDRADAERDFACLAAQGFNALRTYTTPPRWLLDAAAGHGLRVLAGIAWEQHVAFLDEPRRAADIEARVRAAARSVAGHPALLALALGNEIPATIVRWFGHRRVEGYLERLWRAAKAEDPAALVTYVNYPCTEYLDLPFLDFACFNVYLEARPRLRAYLAKLQNIAGDRPLVLGEVGLDSLRAGEAAQARSLLRQVRTTFAAGAAGAFVFAWTDAWHRGGEDITDWRFGLTRADRTPKPALAAVRRGFAAVPFSTRRRWPQASVVVCTRNGARTLAECLTAASALRYPDYELIVVDDGSTDATAAIARAHGVAPLSVAHGGLSAARNLGWRHARGEIVAYLDDDAYPDPDWLSYLVATLMEKRAAGIAGAGGPNLPPPGDGLVAGCVARAPGGPTHVLLTDHEAEHIPGCNMAFWRDRLAAIGGFDEQFTVAGDDVDVCWRFQQRGWTLGFSPAAVVWHHRRGSVLGYWRQQRQYGKAEAALARKWPEKYNAVGHLAWAGRLYGGGLFRHFLGWSRRRIYHGTWGTALFQSVYHAAPHPLLTLPALPEWYLVVLVLVAVCPLAALWPPLLWVAPVAAPGLAASVAHALLGAWRSLAHTPPTVALADGPATRRAARWPARCRRFWLTAWLHLIQPAARLAGRAPHGLTPWRLRDEGGMALPRPRRFALWTELPQAYDARLLDLERRLRGSGAAVLRGGEFDRWDLELRGGLLGAVRLRMAVEEHGGGRQLLHFAVWPRIAPRALAALPVLLLAGGLLAVAGSPLGGGALGMLAALLAARLFSETGTAMAHLAAALTATAREASQTGPAPVLDAVLDPRRGLPSAVGEAV